MNKVLLICIAFLALAVNRSCENDDLNDIEVTPTINGLWNLTSIQGGFADVNYQFSEGDITWDFNLDTNKLHIINNNIGDEGYDGFPTGEYNFSIILFDDIVLVEIDNESFGSYYIQDSELTIDQDGATSGNADGFILGFLR